MGHRHHVPLNSVQWGHVLSANPYKGLEEWFEPEKEVVIVNSDDEAIDRYRFLLNNEKETYCNRKSGTRTGIETAYIPTSCTRPSKNYQDVYLNGLNIAQSDYYSRLLIFIQYDCEKNMLYFLY